MVGEGNVKAFFLTDGEQPEKDDGVQVAGGVCIVLNRVARGGSTWKVTFEQRLEGEKEPR